MSIIIVFYWSNAIASPIRGRNPKGGIPCVLGLVNNLCKVAESDGSSGFQGRPAWGFLDFLTSAEQATRTELSPLIRGL